VVDIRVLGRIEARTDDGAEISVGRERIRAVLGLLVLGSPDMVTTDEIVDALWSESDVAKPESALQMSISRLRTALGDDVIETQAGGYRLTVDDASIDLGRFRGLVRRGRQMHALGQHLPAAEALSQALREWRGPALSDVRRFDFIERASRRLEEERMMAAEELIESQLDAGRHGDAITELTGLVEVSPYRERLWTLLMLALYRSGRQRDALAAFERVRRIFGEELGLEPSPALVELEDRILMHDPSLRPEGSDAGTDGEIAETVTFVSGATIVEEGEPATTVYWIESGSVEIVKVDEEGRAQRVAELGPGQYFGELAATLGVRRTASVRAIEPTVATVLDLEGFRARVGFTDPEGEPEL
jgi:DNA-binding SARP family transcriptional activator